jgi:hypothetical protein
MARNSKIVKYVKGLDGNSHPVMAEGDTRAILLQTARNCGCEMDVRRILEQTDRLLARCDNEQERAEIQKFGILMLDRLFAGSSKRTDVLEIDGKKVDD